MSAYIDTSIIAKLYVEEPDSKAADQLVSKLKKPFYLSKLHRLELVTALRLKVFRGEVSEAAAFAAHSHLLSDINDGFWSAGLESLDATVQRAEHLANEHAAKIGARSLDILHVAAALELNTKVFATNDTRQSALARACGFTVKTMR